MIESKQTYEIHEHVVITGKPAVWLLRKIGNSQIEKNRNFLTHKKRKKRTVNTTLMDRGSLPTPHQ